jgi:mercuric ion binding protein
MIMIKRISFLIVVGIALFFVQNISAQKTVTVTIQTKVYCSHCSACETCGLRFDTELYKLTGLKNFTLAGNTITVSYNPKKLTINKIKECIANCGYDADEVKATEAGLKSLDNCCRKTE